MADDERELLYRRPQGFWAEFNSWWRQVFSSTGKRPDGNAIDQWWLENAERVWPDASCRPDMTDTRTHAKCMRTTETVREYFKKYRQMHRDKRPWQGRAVYTEKPPPKAPKAPPAGAPAPVKRSGSGRQKATSISGSTSADDPDLSLAQGGMDADVTGQYHMLDMPGSGCGDSPQPESMHLHPSSMRFNLMPNMDGGLGLQLPVGMPGQQGPDGDSHAPLPTLSWQGNGLPSGASIAPLQIPAALSSWGSASLGLGMGPFTSPGATSTPAPSPVANPAAHWRTDRQHSSMPPPSQPPPPAAPAPSFGQRSFRGSSASLHAAPALGPLAATAVAALQAATAAPAQLEPRGNTEQLQRLTAQETELERAIAAELAASNALLHAAGRGASCAIEGLSLSAAEHCTDMAFAAVACAAEAAGVPWDNVDTAHPLWHVFEMRAVVYAAQRAAASGQPLQPSALHVSPVHVMRGVVKAVDRLREFVSGGANLPAPGGPTWLPAAPLGIHVPELQPPQPTSRTPTAADMGSQPRVTMAKSASGEASSPITMPAPAPAPMSTGQRIDPQSPKSHTTQHSTPSDTSTTPAPTAGTVLPLPLPAAGLPGLSGPPLAVPRPCFVPPPPIMGPSHGLVTTTTDAGMPVRGPSPRPRASRGASHPTPAAPRGSNAGTGSGSSMPPSPAHATRKRGRAFASAQEAGDEGGVEGDGVRPAKAGSPRKALETMFTSDVVASLGLTPSPFARLPRSGLAGPKDEPPGEAGGPGLAREGRTPGRDPGLGAAGWDMRTPAMGGSAGVSLGNAGPLCLPEGPPAVRASVSGSSHEGATTPLGATYAISPMSVSGRKPVAGADGLKSAQGTRGASPASNGSINGNTPSGTTNNPPGAANPNPSAWFGNGQPLAPPSSRPAPVGSPAYSRFRPLGGGGTPPPGGQAGGGNASGLDEQRLASVFGAAATQLPVYPGMDTALVDALWSWNPAAQCASPAPGSATLTMRASKGNPAPFALLQAQAQLGELGEHGAAALERVASLSDLGHRISWLPRLPEWEGGEPGLTLSRQVSMSSLLMDGRMSADIDGCPLNILLDQDGGPRGAGGLALRLSYQTGQLAGRASAQLQAPPAAR